jgi:hypothetical protein
MDVVEASHLQEIKDYLEKNPDGVFKMRKFNNEWTVGVVDIYDETIGFTASDSSFVGALKAMSALLVK